MDSENSSSPKKSKKTKQSLFQIVQKNPLILWTLPIIGSYIAFCIDTGVLEYYGIPITYAEINVSTIYRSMILGVVIGFVLSFLISIYASIAKGSSLTERVLSSTHVFLLPVVAGFFLYLISQSLWWAVFWSVCGLANLLIPPIFNKKSAPTYSKRVDLLLKEQQKKEAQSEDSVFTAVFTKLGMPIFLFLMLSMFISRIGYLAIKDAPVFLVQNQASTIALKRNDDIYILKTFDPKTFVLNPEFTLVKLDPESLVLKEVNLPSQLKTKSRALEEEKSNIGKEKLIKSLKAFKQQFMSH